jgi:DNA mismatch repair ATPase MutS
MRTSTSILSLVTKRSLVLIDELGRGSVHVALGLALEMLADGNLLSLPRTSPTEGTAVAHAIAEQLIQTKATVLFASHFRDLSQSRLILISAASTPRSDLISTTSFCHCVALTLGSYDAVQK